MPKTTITITSKDGTKKYSGKFIGTVEEWIEILELSEIAQDSYADQCNEWKQLTNKGENMAEVTKIRWLSGGGFVDKEITSNTVGQLRNELSISTEADIAVDGVNVSDTHELGENSVVAAVQNNKSGGC